MREIAELDFGHEKNHNQPSELKSSEVKQPQNSVDTSRRPYGNSSKGNDSKLSGKGDAVGTKGSDQQHHRPPQPSIKPSKQQQYPHAVNGGVEDERKSDNNKAKGSDKATENNKGSDKGSDKDKVGSTMGLRHAPYQGGHMAVSVARFSLCFQPLAEPYIDACDWRIVGPIYSGILASALISLCR